MMSGCYLMGTKVLLPWRVLFTAPLHQGDTRALGPSVSGTRSRHGTPFTVSRWEQLFTYARITEWCIHWVMGNAWLETTGRLWKGEPHLSGDSSMSGEEMGTNESTASGRRGGGAKSVSISVKKCNCESTTVIRVQTGNPSFTRY